MVKEIQTDKVVEESRGREDPPAQRSKKPKQFKVFQILYLIAMHLPQANSLRPHLSPGA